MMPTFKCFSLYDEGGMNYKLIIIQSCPLVQIPAINMSDITSNCHTTDMFMIFYV